MRVIKFLVGLFPIETRKKMRKNMWLFNLYSKSLQKSGLFYGFPTPQKLQKLYVKTIKSQSAEINKKIEKSLHKTPINCLVVLTGKLDNDLHTIRNVKTVGGFNQLFVTGNEELIDQFTAKSLDLPECEITPFSHISENEISSPLLLLTGADNLHPQIFPLLSSYLNDEGENRVMYCDIDNVDNSKIRHSAEFYPDWNPDLHLTSGYVKTGVMICGRDILEHYCRFVEKNTSSSSVIALWLIELHLNKIKVPIIHIPFCLVHRRINNQYQWHQELSEYNYPEFNVFKGENSDVAKISWNTVSTPLVSLIIPTKNGKQLVKNCIESIIDKTTYDNYEILLIDNNSDEQESLEYFEHLKQTQPKISVLKFPFDFNYSAINNFAVKHAKGTIVGLINNDIEVISPQWLDFMIGHVLRDDIGCVGAKLLYPDNRIQHAGVVMGYGGGAGHAHKYFPRYHPGYLNRLIASHNFSAVTAACLLVKKEDYLAVGGLNETELTIAFNDVDFCLRVLELGRRNLYCAEAELYHHESISRGLDDTFEKRERFERELTYLQNRWKDYIKHDPAYNPNLTLRRENFSIKE
jgi:GT2 family glycosyltransferase